MLQASAVRDARTLEPAQRREQHGDDILAHVKDVRFFSKLDLMEQWARCRTMMIETFRPREYVFRMGDKGDKVYIVLTALVLPALSKHRGGGGGGGGGGGRGGPRVMRALRPPRP